MNLPKDAIYGVDLEPDAHLFFSWVLNEETKIKFTHFEVLRRVLPEGEQPGPYDACMMLPVSPPFHSLIPEDLLYDELLIHLFQQGNETQQTENVRQEDTGAPAPEAPSTDQEQAEAKASNEKERTSTETPQQAEAAPHAAPSQQHRKHLQQIRSRQRQKPAMRRNAHLQKHHSRQKQHRMQLHHSSKATKKKLSQQSHSLVEQLHHQKTEHSRSKQPQQIRSRQRQKPEMRRNAHLQKHHSKQFKSFAHLL